MHAQDKIGRQLAKEMLVEMKAKGLPESMCKNSKLYRFWYNREPYFTDSTGFYRGNRNLTTVQQILTPELKKQLRSETITQEVFNQLELMITLEGDYKLAQEVSYGNMLKRIKKKKKS